mgnify:CR=1 FL=1
MFLKKEKPEFEIRPLYSIREELELIKAFCWQPKLAAGKIYTEEEIDAEEQRLNYKLPQPLRELYLVLGDYACEKKDTYFCRLEELHWSGQYWWRPWKEPVGDVGSTEKTPMRRFIAGSGTGSTFTAKCRMKSRNQR